MPLLVDIYPTCWKWGTWFYTQGPSSVFRLAKHVQPQLSTQVTWTKYKLMALKMDRKICLLFFLKEDDLFEIQTDEIQSKTSEEKTACKNCFPNIFENIMKANEVVETMFYTLWSGYIKIYKYVYFFLWITSIASDSIINLRKIKISERFRMLRIVYI